MAHDFQYNEIKLDYTDLLNAVTFACGYALTEIDRALGEMRYDITAYSKHTWASQRLEEHATKLRIATETRHALMALRDREKVEIINRPELTPERTAELDNYYERSAK